MPMTSVMAINPESLSSIGRLQSEISKKKVFCIRVLDRNQLSNNLSLLPVPDLVYTNSNVPVVSDLQNDSVKDIPTLCAIKNSSLQNDSVTNIPPQKAIKNNSRLGYSVQGMPPLKKIKTSSRTVKDKRALQKIKNKSSQNDSVKDKPPSNKIKLVKPSESAEDNTKKHVNESFCVVCNLKFTNVDMLLDHKTEVKYMCRVCASEFDCHTELEKHFFNHDISRCKICREQFYCKKDLLQHRHTVHAFTKVEAQCEICNKTYTSSLTLRKHIRLCHTDERDCHKCIVCGNGYKFFGQLKTHAIRAHSPYESVECKLCSKIYEGPLSLKCHIDRKHLFSKRNIPASCSICGKVLSSLGALAKHKETHDNTESVCEICGQTLKTKSLLLCHMDTQHPKKGLFKCKICNEEVGDKRTLQKHQRKHKIKKLVPVCCEICGKEYKNHYILKEHQKIHSSNRPYKCRECGAGFRQDVALKQHLRVHSNVGKYKCGNCGMTFKWKQTFDKHCSKCEGSGSESEYSEDS